MSLPGRGVKDDGAVDKPGNQALSAAEIIFCLLNSLPTNRADSRNAPNSATGPAGTQLLFIAVLMSLWLILERGISTSAFL